MIGVLPAAVWALFAAEDFYSLPPRHRTKEMLVKIIDETVNEAIAEVKNENRKLHTGKR